MSQARKTGNPTGNLTGVFLLSPGYTLSRVRNSYSARPLQKKGVFPMSTEDNKALVRRAFDALNQRNWATFYELLAPEIALHNASMTIQGLEASKQFLSVYYT